MLAQLGLRPMRSDVSSSRGGLGSDEPSQTHSLGRRNPSVTIVSLSVSSVSEVLLGG